MIHRPPYKYLGVLNSLGAPDVELPACKSTTFRGPMNGKSWYTWTVYADDGRPWQIYVDYKGRGFVVVDPRLRRQVTGLIRLDWKNGEIVAAAVAAVSMDMRERS